MDTAINQQLAIIHVNTVIYRLEISSMWTVNQQELLLESSLEHARIKLLEVSLVLSVDLNKLLGVVNLFLKQNEVGHLSDEIRTHRNLAQLALLVELRVVHRKID